MIFDKVRSHAKINLSLNITGKISSLHKIESLVSFASLHDEILIKRIRANKHNISFNGKFSQKIGKKNTISTLIKILEKKKLIHHKKFMIKVNKKIPSKAGLGGGSMNAASVLKYFIKKKIIRVSKNEIFKICKLIGSDVILGLNFTNSILNSKNEIKYFRNYRKFNILIIKPNFGCSTKEIFSKVKKFNKPELNKPHKKMFETSFLKKMKNQLEPFAFSKFPRLKKIKSYLENIPNTLFVRLTGSGSALVAFYQSKEKCENAKRKFNKKYKNYWCIASKTI